MTAEQADVRLLLVAGPGRPMLRAAAALDQVAAAWGPRWRLRPVPTAREAPSALRGHVLVLASTSTSGGRAVSAAGCSADPADAVRRALWELRERHAAATFAPRAPVVLDSHARLVAAGTPALHPHELRGRPLRPERWPYPDWDTGTVLPWIAGTDLAGGGAVRVPLFLAGLRRDVPGGLRGEVTSIGLAAGPDAPAAVAAARRELLERDRLIRAWRYGQPLRQGGVRRDAEWTVATLTGTTSAGDPLLVVLQSDPAAGLLGIGSAAHPDAVAAGRHAEAEAAQLATLAWLRRRRGAPSGPPTDFADRVVPGRDPDAVLARLLTDRAGRTAAPGGPPAAGTGRAVAVRLTPAADPVAVCRVVATDVEPMEAADDCARSRPGSVPVHTDPHPFG
ncbi:MAG: YcaO-like family protein [Mycobacteriales bacterium]